MAQQIKVNYVLLKNIESKMSYLNKRLATKKLIINFKDTKGNVADSIIKTSNELNEITKSLSNLTYNTEQIIKNSADSFEYVDLELANKIVNAFGKTFGGK